MQSQDYAAHWQKWSAEMAADSAPGGKIDVGPVEALASKPGRRTPTRSKQRSRVPPYSTAQPRKSGPPS
jgi:hypothetical protein